MYSGSQYFCYFGLESRLISMTNPTCRLRNEAGFQVAKHRSLLFVDGHTKWYNTIAIEVMEARQSGHRKAKRTLNA